MEEFCGSPINFQSFPVSFLLTQVSIHKRKLTDFSNFSKIAENLELVGFQKRLVNYPMVSRVVGDNPESRLSIPLELGVITGGLGTWDAPELLAVSVS